MVLPMRSRPTYLAAAVVLAVCLVSQLAELFDQWDHTLQTGNDTEYLFVLLALCVGVAYALRWVRASFHWMASLREAIPCLCGGLQFLSPIQSGSPVLIPASPPSALRI